MKKRILWSIIAVLIAAAVGVGVFFAFFYDWDAIGNLPVTLETPQVTLGEDLSLSWTAVEGAESYLVNVNGSDLFTTSALTCPPMETPGEYTLCVLALGGGGRSERSQTVSYTVYKVELPENELYTIAGAHSVGQNRDYSFSVALAEGCTECTPVVKANGKELSAVDGIYSVLNVTEDLTVTIEGVALNRYAVQLPSGTGYSIDGQDFTLYGKDYSFRLNLDKSYDRSDVTVKANGQVLKAEDGVYTVENTTSDVEITVSGVTVNRYNILLTTGRGYTITPSGTQTVAHGGSISFTVTPDDVSYGITVKLDGKAMTATDGKYTVSDVTDDHTVTVAVTGLPELTVVDRLLETDNWKTIPQGVTSNSISLSPNSSLKGSYFQQLWDEGYTHLVFTVNAKPAADNNTNYTHGGDWIRYWQGFAPNTDVDVRIDLNEFHDGNTWYDLNFNSGNMTVSDPRAYQSHETLLWQKQNDGGSPLTNIYFALEDGYYVLETRQNGAKVVSPTEWLQKYCVEDEVQQRTWVAYFDYLEQGNNTRAMVWGWGNQVNILHENVNGGWIQMNNMQVDGYTEGEVFSLHLDSAGTARFKIMDVISNRNGWNEGFHYTQLSDSTFQFSTNIDMHVFRLASTNEWLDAGYEGIRLTLSGNLNGNILVYGDGDWANSEINAVTEAELPAGGTYTVEVPFSKLNGKNLQLVALILSGSITDMQVTIEPVGEAKPLVIHRVTLPTGKGFTANGEATVRAEKNYSFTVTLEEGYDPAKLVVKANEQILVAENGVYTVQKVSEDIVITVSGVELYAYQVTAPVGNDFTFQGAAAAKYGEDYVFTVTPNKTGDNVIVTVNGETIAATNGKYTVRNVKEDLVITARCLDSSLRMVTVPTGSRYQVTPSGEQLVEAGGSFSFTVTANNPDDTITVKANGKLLTASQGVYTISNIQENTVVTITAHNLVEEILNADSWSAGGTAGQAALTVPANSSLKGEYLKLLWDEGYTHLVFTVHAGEAADKNTNFIHSGQWNRYWQTFTPNTNVELRIDLNEFRDGTTWYGINFNSGEMTVSNPRAYRSEETLAWVKSSSNIYFAVENGYYVLETRGNDFNVTSPTEWLAKYCIGNDVSQQTWFAYTDYITQGANTRAVVWGWNTDLVSAQTLNTWSAMNNVQIDGYTDGEAFVLQLDKAGVARFKLSDIVSNRNEWNGYTFTYIDDMTYSFTAPVDGQKFYLATTQELIAAGATKLKVTFTGDPGDGVLYFGNDIWGDGKYILGVSKNELTAENNYTSTVEIDLSQMGGNPFTVQVSGSISQMQIHMEPVD